jgi:hypothetical protein
VEPPEPAAEREQEFTVASSADKPVVLPHGIVVGTLAEPDSET